MTRPFFKSMAFAALLAVLTLGAWADAGAATNEEVETVITTMFPGAKVVAIADAPIDGLIELSVEDPMGNKGIIYIDEALENIFVGKILNVSTKRNLTKERYDEFNRVDFSKIPLDDKVVLGDRKAPLKAIVFVDPDCPYCAKLHPVMKQIVEERKDIAFYQSMYPLLSIHPKAYDKGHAVLCAKSNEESLKLLEDAYAKKTLPKPDCDNTTMEKQMALGKSLGVNSTPTILFMDGSRVGGVMEKDALIAAMDERKPKE